MSCHCLTQVLAFHILIMSAWHAQKVNFQNVSVMTCNIARIEDVSGSGDRVQFRGISCSHSIFFDSLVTSTKTLTIVYRWAKLYVTDKVPQHFERVTIQY